MLNAPRFALPLLAALSMAVASPAAALSCLKPDPVTAFAQANAAEETYVVVVGELNGGFGPRPAGMEGQPRSYDARFTGHTINRSGPFEAINQNVFVVENCAGPWCAEVETGRKFLSFMEVLPGGKGILRVGPCYSNIFYDPTPAQLNAIKSCFVKGCTTM